MFKNSKLRSPCVREVSGFVVLAFWTPAPCFRPCHFKALACENERNESYGLETICNEATFHWENPLSEYELTDSLNTFKRKIKKLEWMKLSL